MKPINELKAAVLAALDADYMQGAINDLGKCVRYNVEDAMNEALQDSGYLQTCLNCNHFDEPREFCTKGGTNARPPARIIAFGCPAFEDGSVAVPEVRPQGAGALIPADRLAAYLTPGHFPAAQPKPKPSTGFDDMDDDIPF